MNVGTFDIAHRFVTSFLLAWGHALRSLGVWLLMLPASLLPVGVSANGLSVPAGEVILTVSGNIRNVNSGERADFDLAMLEALPQVTIATHTPWTEGLVEFTGVRIDRLLEEVGAITESFTAIALDDYWYDLTNMDFKRYPIVLAHKKNGQNISLRNLGPLWIMFPFDDYPELLTERYKAASVWQLREIVVK